MSDSDIAALFDEWNAALQSRDAKRVASLYDDTYGILLPTLSDRVRHNRDEIEDYFVSFTARGPVGTINEQNIRRFGEIAINSGVYTFQFDDGSFAQARFTFMYRWDGDRWMIVEHHSSQMPGIA